MRSFILAVVIGVFTTAVTAQVWADKPDNKEKRKDSSSNHTQSSAAASHRGGESAASQSSSTRTNNGFTPANGSHSARRIPHYAQGKRDLFEEPREPIPVRTPIRPQTPQQVSQPAPVNPTSTSTASQTPSITNSLPSQATDNIDNIPTTSKIISTPERTLFERMTCSEERKTCPDGTTTVGRNPDSNCTFDRCP